MSNRINHYQRNFHEAATKYGNQVTLQELLHVTKDGQHSHQYSQEAVNPLFRQETIEQQKKTNGSLAGQQNPVEAGLEKVLNAQASLYDSAGTLSDRGSNFQQKYLGQNQTTSLPLQANLSTFFANRGIPFYLRG